MKNFALLVLCLGILAPGASAKGSHSSGHPHTHSRSHHHHHRRHYHAVRTFTPQPETVCADGAVDHSRNDPCKKHGAEDASYRGVPPLY